MSNSINDPVESSIELLLAPSAEIWRLLFEIYNVEVDKSILTCEAVYGSFYKHLKNVRKNIAKGCCVLGEIYLELTVMRRSGRLDEVNTVKLEVYLNNLVALFQSQDDLNLEKNTNVRADKCDTMINHQMEVLNKKKKKADDVVSLSLLTVGLGFAGFATASSVSAKFMSFSNLKSKVLLGVSSGCLVFASALQLAEYMEYNDRFNNIIHNLTVLKQNLTSLISAVKVFSAELIDLINQIKRYSQETRMDVLMVNNFSPTSQSFSVKVNDMAVKTKDLQVILLRMEVSVLERGEFLKTGKSRLPEKSKRSSKLYSTK